MASTREKTEQSASEPPFRSDRRKLKAAEVLNLLMSSSFLNRRNQCLNQMVRAKRSEKGLLTPDNCVVSLIDHQPQMLFGVSSFDRQTIINNTVALAKATQVFDVPIVLTTVESKRTFERRPEV
jgi:hypothetical protein